MRMWLLRLQSVLMRIFGIRRLEAKLSSRLDSAYAGLDTHLGQLRADLFERESSIDRRLADLAGAVAAVQTHVFMLRDEEGGRARSLTERGDTLDVNIRDLHTAVADVRSYVSALRDEEGGRARSATERGDTLDVNIQELRKTVAELAAPRTDDALNRRIMETLERSVGDLPVEVSSIRADIAREMESIADEHTAAWRSVVETLARIAGELRVEMSRIQVDIAREMETVNERLVTASGSLTDTIATSFGDMRVELSGLRSDMGRKGEVFSDGLGAVAERRKALGQPNR